MAYLSQSLTVLVTFTLSTLSILSNSEGKNIFRFLETVGELSVISNMASAKDATAAFFLHGNTRQYDYVLKLYPQVLKLKAEEKKKPEELIKLDEW